MYVNWKLHGYSKFFLIIWYTYIFVTKIETLWSYFYLIALLCIIIRYSITYHTISDEPNFLMNLSYFILSECIYYTNVTIKRFLYALPSPAIFSYFRTSYLMKFKGILNIIFIQNGKIKLQTAITSHFAVGYFISITKISLLTNVCLVIVNRTSFFHLCVHVII